LEIVTESRDGMVLEDKFLVSLLQRGNRECYKSM
jgi:hypothetical protein